MNVLAIDLDQTLLHTDKISFRVHAGNLPPAENGKPIIR